MAEQKTTYQEKKDKISIDISNTHSEYKTTGTGFVLFERLAEEEISRQAEAIRVALSELMSDDPDVRHVISGYLIEHGYIEPKTEINIL